MRKHCGNCANHREETNQFSEECGKCVSARLKNGEITDPSHWRALPQTNADRIRTMSDEELAKFLADEIPHGDCCGCDLECATFEGDKFENSCHNAFYRWLKQPVGENK